MSLNRIEIKRIAHEIISDKSIKMFFCILLYFVVICLFEFLVTGVLELIGPTVTTKYFALLDETIEIPTFYGLFIDLIVSFFDVIISIGIANYVLKISRGMKMTLSAIFNDVIDILRKHWFALFFGLFLITLNIIIGTILFLIPGIIASLGLTFFYFVVIDDSENQGPIKLLIKTWQMMKCYKLDYFIFGLTFILWILLCVFIIPIVYVMPYILVAEAVYYNKIKEQYDSKIKLM